jgi:hypothetical protein
LVRKHGGKRPLGRPKHKCNDNFKMDLWEVGWVMDWIDSSYDRDWWRSLVNTVVSLRVPYSARNFLTSWESVSFSRRNLLHVNSYLVSWIVLFVCLLQACGCISTSRSRRWPLSFLQACYPNAVRCPVWYTSLLSQKLRL